MRSYYADLHVHLGRGGGKPVKISASGRLTLDSALEEALTRKGLGIIGLVDGLSRYVRGDWERLLRAGVLSRASGGGYRRGELLVLPGMEFEFTVRGRPVHGVGLWPDLDAAERFFRWAALDLPERSPAYWRGLPAELAGLIGESGGLFFPAHIFTPHRGLLAAASDWREVFPEGVAAVELGLSADAEMAAEIKGLAGVRLLAGSDAHSAERIAREFTVLRLAEASFSEIVLALAGAEGRDVAALYGLDPRLGKYYRSFCRHCGRVEAAPPVTVCPHCGGEVVVGVLDRIRDLGGNGPRFTPPVYHHQVPLAFLPGIGPVLRERLLRTFGSEIFVLHEASETELRKVLGGARAALILAARSGTLRLRPGAGGIYGAVEG